MLKQSFTFAIFLALVSATFNPLTCAVDVLAYEEWYDSHKTCSLLISNLAASVCDGGRGTVTNGECEMTQLSQNSNTKDANEVYCDYYKIMFWCANRIIPECYLDYYQKYVCPTYEQLLESNQCNADCADSSVLSLALALVSSLL